MGITIYDIYHCNYFWTLPCNIAVIVRYIYIRYNIKVMLVDFYYYQLLLDDEIQKLLMYLGNFVYKKSSLQKILLTSCLDFIILY